MSAELGDQVPVEVDRGPARLSSALATIAALLAVLTSAPLSVLAVLLGGVGFVVLAVALFARGSRRLLWLGTVSIFGGALDAGARAAAPPALVLTSVAAVLLAWDVGQNAISVGEQLGRGAETWRAELVHAAVSTVVAVLVAVAAYAVFGLGVGSPPVLAVLLFVGASLLLTWALDS
jgi:uncharacterized membrane protein YbaN (DUF454 family)